MQITRGTESFLIEIVTFPALVDSETPQDHVLDKAVSLFYTDDASWDRYAYKGP